MDWQSWTAATAVGLAATYLLYRALHLIGGQSVSGCGACPNRRSSSADVLHTKELPLVQIADNHSSRPS